MLQEMATNKSRRSLARNQAIRKAEMQEGASAKCYWQIGQKRAPKSRGAAIMSEIGNGEIGNAEISGSSHQHLAGLCPQTTGADGTS